VEIERAPGAAAELVGGALEVAGLDSGWPPNSATWSEPITQACGCAAPTERALASARRSASEEGPSPTGASRRFRAHDLEGQAEPGSNWRR
jgi:hypothetical protein